MTQQSRMGHKRSGGPKGQEDTSFLVEASHLLAESLDYEATLATLAELALPHLGAWCIVDIWVDDEMRRVAVVHADPEMQALARRLGSGWPPERDDPFGVPRAVRTGETEIIPNIPDEMLMRVSRSEENLEILRSLGIGSLLVVPLIARGEVLGAITYVSPRGGRMHTEEDVATAEDLAAQCAIAVDNARLYRMAQSALRARDTVLGYVAHDLRNPLGTISLQTDMIVDETSAELRAAHGRSSTARWCAWTS
jgi:GAF domain-containing protein